MSAKFVLHSTNEGKAKFELVTDQGRRLLSSELYESKQAARNGISTIRRQVADAEIVDAEAPKAAPAKKAAAKKAAKKAGKKAAAKKTSTKRTSAKKAAKKA